MGTCISLSLSLYLSIYLVLTVPPSGVALCVHVLRYTCANTKAYSVTPRPMVCVPRYDSVTQRVCPTVRHRGILLVWLVTSVNTCQWPTYGIQWFSPLYRTQASLSHWVKLQSIFNFIIWFKKFYYHSRTNLLRVRPLDVYLWRVSSKVSSTSPSSHSTTHFPPSPAPTTLHSYHPVKFLNLPTIRFTNCDSWASSVNSVCCSFAPHSITWGVERNFELEAPRMIRVVSFTPPPHQPHVQPKQFTPWND